MKTKHYAFQWHIGIGYKYSDGTYAGDLFVFDSASKRDKWVDAGPDFDCLDCRMLVTKEWVKKYNLEGNAIHQDLINYDY